MSSITAGNGVVYLKRQTGEQTAYSNVAITDAIRVRSISWNADTMRVRRENKVNSREGTLPALAGPRKRSGRIEVERTGSATAGSASTWQQADLWRCAANVKLDESSSSYIKLTDQVGRVLGTDYYLAEIVEYEQNGRRRAVYNAVLAYVETTVSAGGELIDIFDFDGWWVDDASSATNDVAGVYDYEITNAADGDWVVVVADDRGNVETATYNAGGDLESEIVTGIVDEGTITTIATLTNGGSDNLVITAVNAGRTLSVTVTTPGAGAGTLTTTTAPVSFSRQPTFQNDREPVVAFGGTITHQDGDAQDALNMGSFKFSAGGSIEPKMVLGASSSPDANGYGLARVPAVREIGLSYEADASRDFDIDASLKDQDSLSFTYDQTSDIYFNAGACTVSGVTEGERAGDRLIQADLEVHSGAADGGAWEWRIYTSPAA